MNFTHFANKNHNVRCKEYCYSAIFMIIILMIFLLLLRYFCIFIVNEDFCFYQFLFPNACVFCLYLVVGIQSIGILYVCCSELRFKSCSPQFLLCHSNSVIQDATLCSNEVSAGASSQIYMVYI